MSDEPVTPPPALRLKPRLRPADDPASAAASTAGDLSAFPPPPPQLSVTLPPSNELPPAIEPPPTPPVAKVSFKPRLVPPADAQAQAAATTPLNPNPTPATILPSAVAQPSVGVPAPAIFAPPPSPSAPVVPQVVSDAPVIADPASSVPPAAAAGVSPADLGGKFKLKPKTPLATPPPAAAIDSSFPAVSEAPPPIVAPPAFPPPVAKPMPPFAKAAPPFPVAAPPGLVKSGAPPVIGAPKVSDPFPPEEPAVSAEPVRRKSSGMIVALLSVVILAGVGYFGWTYLQPKAAPAAAAKPTPSAVPAAPKAETTKAEPVKATPASDPSPTPSETLNRLAHAPAKAINQAQEALEARRTSGQARIDAASIGEDLPDRPATPPPASTAKATPPAANPTATATTPTTTTIAPGVSATTAVLAAPEATAAFRSYIANAKVSGVFQGNPARVVVNGKLTRVGDVVDPTLGISFEGIDPARRHLVFKDKTGATVSRRF